MCSSSLACPGSRAAGARWPLTAAGSVPGGRSRPGLGAPGAGRWECGVRHRVAAGAHCAQVRSQRRPAAGAAPARGSGADLSRLRHPVRGDANRRAGRSLLAAVLLSKFASGLGFPKIRRVVLGLSSEGLHKGISGVSAPPPSRKWKISVEWWWCQDLIASGDFPCCPVLLPARLHGQGPLH